MSSALKTLKPTHIPIIETGYLITGVCVSRMTLEPHRGNFNRLIP